MCARSVARQRIGRDHGQRQHLARGRPAPGRVAHEVVLPVELVVLLLDGRVVHAVDRRPCLLGGGGNVPLRLAVFLDALPLQVDRHLPAGLGVVDREPRRLVVRQPAGISQPDVQVEADPRQEQQALDRRRVVLAMLERLALRCLLVLAAHYGPDVSLRLGALTRPLDQFGHGQVALHVVMPGHGGRRRRLGLRCPLRRAHGFRKLPSKQRPAPNRPPWRLSVRSGCRPRGGTPCGPLRPGAGAQTRSAAPTACLQTAPALVRHQARC